MTILSTTQHSGLDWWWILLIAAGITFVLSIIILAMCDFDFNPALIPPIIVIFIISTVIGFNVNHSAKYTEVKALVDNDVSWKEVNDKYELLDTDGDIYIFSVREEVKDSDG